MDQQHGTDSPDATTAFGARAENETDERSGVAGAAADPADGAKGATPGVLPPLMTTEVDATPVRGRFTDGGQ